ncbi:hypothetical protein PISL3812_06540 [Talaromyces islandicus]|uniref:Uncharacterized protein n=1 Tax=Talaromyces islandicus TaxID=28573 RepID=A0A0U1M1V5_TALIS|nr:hypothetical protein PISL3812_06540 [Talaromyces islandicus]
MNLPNFPYNAGHFVFANSTIRQTFRVSIGGAKLRLRLSNVFGVTDLTITEVTIALPDCGVQGTPIIQPETLRAVTFSGKSSFTIPAGGLVISDAIDFSVKPLAVVSVSIYLQQGQQEGSITGHPGSRVNVFMTHGNQTHAIDLTGPAVQSVAHWYFISSVEVWSPDPSRALVIIGDSITDGRESDTDKDNRWPDLVVNRMQENLSTSCIAVLNQAAGGNRILQDGLGPNVISRIDRDILAHSGVKYAMIFEGINDIGTADTDEATQKNMGDSLITAYTQIAARIRTQGIPIFIATITPFSTPSGSDVKNQYSNPTREQTRQRINEWIRTSGVFDAVLDFDKLLRDVNDPSILASQYDSGDHLHPNVLAFQAIANAFPLEIFDIFAGGVIGYS